MTTSANTAASAIFATVFTITTPVTVAASGETANACITAIVILANQLPLLLVELLLLRLVHQLVQPLLQLLLLQRLLLLVHIAASATRVKIISAAAIPDAYITALLLLQLLLLLLLVQVLSQLLLLPPMYLSLLLTLHLSLLLQL